MESKHAQSYTHTKRSENVHISFSFVLFVETIENEIERIDIQRECLQERGDHRDIEDEIEDNTRPHEYDHI
jgi:hypothetical protein